jgi:hypothetical protein
MARRNTTFATALQRSVSQLRDGGSNGRKGGRGGRIRTLGPRFWSSRPAVSQRHARSLAYSSRQPASVKGSGLGSTPWFYISRGLGLVTSSTPSDGAKLRRDASIIAVLVGTLTLVGAHIIHADLSASLLIVGIQVLAIKLLGRVLSPWA